MRKEDSRGRQAWENPIRPT